MRTTEPYRIVVLSPGDADRAAEAIALIPDAVVFAPETARDAYESAIAPARLVFHAPVENEAQRVNAALGAFEEPVLVLFTDAYRGLRVMDHRQGARYGEPIRDSDMVLDVVENGVQCAIDADIGVFRWAVTTDTKRYSACDPFALTGGRFYPYGVRGKARARRLNPDLEQPSVAWALDTLTDDRIMMVDTRFCFDHGDVDLEQDIFVRRRGPDVDGDMEYKVLVDAGNEERLAELYEEMIAQGLEAKLIT